MRNILFIVLPYLLERGELPSSKLRSFKAFPYGLLSMATYAERNSSHHDNIRVLDCNFSTGEYYLDIVKKTLIDFQPDLVGISMMFDNSYKHVKDLTTAIKGNKKDTVIVIGGSAATSSYKTIINEQADIDGVCFSEGELPFLRLINSDDMISALENDVSWVTRKSVKNCRIPKKSVVMNLDDVIDIDYSLVDIESYNMREAFSPFSGTKPNGKQFFLVSSRGCPFKCVFCMRSADDDKSMRFASVDAVIKHVRDLIERFDMSVLTFYDDQILFNKKRAKQLFKELAQFNLRIECPNGLSVAFIDDELASLMKKAGMDTINLAIESGSPYVLNEIIHKPLKLNMVKPVVDILRKHGFWIHGFFVSGIPGETDNNRDETIKFIKDVGLDWSGFSLAIPSRGSELYRICVDNGYIKKDLAIDELDPNKYIINTPEYSPEHVIKKTYLMNLDVNFVNNYRMKHGDYEIAAKAFKEVLKITPDHAFAHYYLAKALERIGNDSTAINTEMEHFRTIIEENEEWKGYAQFFNIA